MPDMRQRFIPPPDSFIKNKIIIIKDEHKIETTFIIVNLLPWSFLPVKTRKPFLTIQHTTNLSQNNISLVPTSLNINDLAARQQLLLINLKSTWLDLLYIQMLHNGDDFMIQNLKAYLVDYLGCLVQYTCLPVFISCLPTEIDSG